MARCRVRVTKAKELSLHVVERRDAVVKAGKTDRMARKRAIEVRLDEHGFNGFGAGEVGYPNSG